MLQLPFRLVLASQSPRRAALLRQIGLAFDVIPAHLPEEEITFPWSHFSEYVQQLALQKAEAVRKTLGDPAVIIASDTIVELNGEIINKPKSEEDAYQILKHLSGKTHTVYTSYVLLPHALRLRTRIGYRATAVTFRKLDDEEIWAYIATGSPLDKAGAYGIQDDFGAVFVEKIVGCYYTVVGLPLSRVYQELKELKAEYEKAYAAQTVRK